MNLKCYNCIYGKKQQSSVHSQNNRNRCTMNNFLLDEIQENDSQALELIENCREYLVETSENTAKVHNFKPGQIYEVTPIETANPFKGTELPKNVLFKSGSFFVMIKTVWTGAIVVYILDRNFQRVSDNTLKKVFDPSLSMALIIENYNFEHIPEIEK